MRAPKRVAAFGIPPACSFDRNRVGVHAYGARKRGEPVSPAHEKPPTNHMRSFECRRLSDVKFWGTGLVSSLLYPPAPAAGYLLAPGL